MKTFDYRILTTNGALAILPLTSIAAFAIGAEGFWAVDATFVEICALRARGFRFC